MAAYIKGLDRQQRTMFPDYIDEYVEANAPVRLFDSFVNNLDMDELGFIRAMPKQTGTPGYDPRDQLKLYIYGYFYQVRSSRRLERECCCNIEVMWLIRKLRPDFRTIADFRKDNRTAIAKVFKEFNKFCAGLKLFSKSYISIDGSKFKAVNAKDRNFTLNKLDDRIKRLDEHIAMYMEELDACDAEEGKKISRQEKERKLEACRERKALYESYRDQLEESGEAQLSLTDPDARLMKQSEGFCVGYNVQTAVDSESHLIAGYNVTNSPTDHGLLMDTASEVKADFEVDILASTADKGYEDPEDHAEALVSGIVPNVIQRNGEDTEEVRFEYHEVTISEEQRNSARPEDLKACLEAGVVPAAYKDILSEGRVVEVKQRVADVSDSSILKLTPEEMRAKAMEGYFVRDAERNLVYCPQGEILRQKSEKRSGEIRYCNKLACKRCGNKCTKSKFKEADFSKDTLIRPANRSKGGGETASKGSPGKTTQTVVKKMVSYILHLDQKMMESRKCLSEHPFGTIKRSLGQYYFLLKGFEKIRAEMGLFCLSYNMRRAINLKGMPALLKALG